MTATPSDDEIRRVHRYECATRGYHDYEHVEELASGLVAIICTHCDETWRVVGPGYSFGARVRAAGGGMVELLVDRDTPEYPEVGAHVVVHVEVKQDA